MTETPKYIVNVIQLQGVNSRTGLDEKTRKVLTYPCGAVLSGYAMVLSSENVLHVRISPLGSKTPEWIRVCERDGTNPLVILEEIKTPEDALAEAIRDLANSVKMLSNKTAL